MESQQKYIIGKILKIARHANNITLAAASCFSGVSTIYISEIEQGKKRNVSEDILTKLGNAYGLKLAQIKDLVAYYENLNVDEDRKFRLTLMKTLEMIEGNDEPIEGIV